jgi:ABC-type transport system substrate-binding protein
VRRRGLPTLLLLAVLAGACSRPAPAAAPSAPAASPTPRASPSASPELSTFRYGLREPASLVPGDVTDPDGLVVVDALFDSLTTYDPDGRVTAAAATAWRHDEGGRVWTFDLRQNATFADPDRTPVTAEDFVFSWTRAAAGGAAGYHLELVEGYEALRAGAATSLAGLSAPDPWTLVVQLRQPFADLPAILAHPALGPLPRARYEADPLGFAAHPVGNGPFAAQPREEDMDFLRAVRFPGWRNGDGPAWLDEVVFRFSDAETAYIAFQQDRVDFATLPAGALSGARERYDDGGEGAARLLDGPTGQLYFLGMDLQEPPLDQVEVRQALSLAIDREALAAGVREGNADPAYGIVPPGIPDVTTDPCAACTFDPERARALFAEAGVTELELWFNRGGGHDQVAALLVEQLAAVGVTLRTRTPPDRPDATPFAAYLDALRAGEAPVFRFGWTLDYPVLDDAVTPLLASWLAGQDGAANYGRYADPEVDALLTEARATVDDASRRRQLYQSAAALALDRDQAVVPLLTFRHAAVVSDRFENFTLNSLGLPDLAEVRAATP